MRDHRNSSNIWSILFDFSYNPASLESWVKLMAQVTVVGAAIVGVKALDGDVCGQGWSVMLPQTWAQPAGCFVRSLVKNVPNSFLEVTPATPSSDQVIEPSPTPSPTPLP